MLILSSELPQVARLSVVHGFVSPSASSPNPFPCGDGLSLQCSVLLSSVLSSFGGEGVFNKNLLMRLTLGPVLREGYSDLGHQRA